MSILWRISICLIGIGMLLGAFAGFGLMFEFVDANMRLRPAIMLPVIAVMATGITAIFGIGMVMVGAALGIIKDEPAPPKPPAQE